MARDHAGPGLPQLAHRVAVRARRHNLPGVYAKATALYEAAFAPEDVCIVAAGRFVQRLTYLRLVVPAQPKRDLFSFAAAQGLDLGAARQRKEVIESGAEDPYEDGTWALEWTCRPSRSFGHARILEGLANCDHAIEPWIDDLVYVVAPEKRLLFYMYDDRGLDMVATDRAVLAPILSAIPALARGCFPRADGGNVRGRAGIWPASLG